MISYPRTLGCYCCFDMVFIFIVNLYKYQKVRDKSIPANIVCWLRNTILMPNYRASCSVLRWMSMVWNSEIRNMVLLSTFGLLLTCFCFGFLYKFVMCMIEKKNTKLFICIHKRVKSIVFAMFIKFIDESIRSSNFNHVK